MSTTKKLVFASLCLLLLVVGAVVLRVSRQGVSVGVRQTQAQAQIFVSDTLSDTAGVNLTAHTGTTGATWTKVTGVTGDLIFGTTPGGVRTGSNNVTAAYIASGTPTQADYDVQATYDTQAAGYAYLLARCSSSAYTCYAGGRTGSGSYALFRYNTATPTSLITAAGAPSSGSHVMKLSVRGSGATVTLTLYDNATQVLTFSDVSGSRITTAGKAGFQSISTVAPTDANTIHLSNFTANESVNATTYSAALSAANGGSGAAVTITLQGDGVTTSTVTPAVSGVSGTFSPTTKALNGTTPVTLTFTPSSTGTATLSFTNDGGLTNPSNLTYTVATSQIVLKGNSLTYGVGATSGQGAITGTTYPADVLTYLGPTWTGVNKGVSGQKMSAMISNFAADVTVQYSSAYTTHILCLEGGTNDIGATTDSAATIYGYLVTLAGMGRTAGFKVIVCSIPRCDYASTSPAGTYPRQYAAAFNPVADSVDALIRANWRSFADGFADYAADTRFSDYTNTTYFAADRVHYTDAGYAILAAYETSAIQQVISGGTVAATTVAPRKFIH